MSQSSTLGRLQDWFASCTNGEWEHRYGIVIRTLDNPGWAVSLDLANTRLQDREFIEANVDRTPTDWFRCRIEGTVFRGYGGPANLEEILGIFLDWADTSAAASDGSVTP